MKSIRWRKIVALLTSLVIGGALVAPATAGGGVERRTPLRARVPGRQVELIAGDLVAAQAPGGVTQEAAAVGVLAAAVPATFVVTFDSQFSSASAQAAVKAGLNAWASKISSPVPIRVSVAWRPLDSTVLATSGPYWEWLGYAGRSDRYYPDALADALNGADLCTSGNGCSPSSPDVVIYFNQSQRWYTGTDGRVPSTSYEMRAVTIRAASRALGIASNLKHNGGSATFGDAPTAWDYLLRDQLGRPLVDLPDPSADLANASVSNAVVATGPRTATIASSGAMVHSPSAFVTNTSLVYLSETAYPAGSNGAALTPTINRGEAIADPGTLAAALVGDLGWDEVPPPAVPKLSLADVSISEGRSGTKNVSVVATLSVTAPAAVTMTLSTSNGTAVAPGDYTARSATVTIAKGQKTATFAVAIKGDTTKEPDETFTVNASAVSGADVAKGTATVTITNDD